MGNFWETAERGLKWSQADPKSRELACELCDKTTRGSNKLDEQGNHPLSEEKKSGGKKLLERTKIKDKKAPGKNNPNEIAELRKKKAGVQPTGDHRFEELSRKKELSSPEQKELQKKLQSRLEHTDPHWREADRHRP
jgi:hypothetical protein